MRGPCTGDTLKPCDRYHKSWDDTIYHIQKTSVFAVHGLHLWIHDVWYTMYGQVIFKSQMAHLKACHITEKISSKKSDVKRRNTLDCLDQYTDY